MEPDAEREIIQQVKAGDPEPFATIVRKYQNLVASVAYRMGVSRGGIEDVVSEVFMKVYTRLHQYDPQYALSSWIYRIATNHVLDEYRRHGSRRAVALDEIAEPSDPHANTAARSELGERDRLVRAAVLDLPDDYRRVLILKHFEELPVDKIAEILEMPEGTVKVRLMRGRARLGKLLAERHPEYFAREAAGALS